MSCISFLLSVSVRVVVCFSFEIVRYLYTYCCGLSVVSCDSVAIQCVIFVVQCVFV